MIPGEEIIKALLNTSGDVSRVTIRGHTWVRHDTGSPEAALAEAQGKVAELTTEVDCLRALLQEAGRAMSWIDESAHREQPKRDFDDPESDYKQVMAFYACAALIRPVLAQIKAETGEMQ